MAGNDFIKRSLSFVSLFLAVVSLQKALPDKKNPEALLSAGRSALALGYKEKDPKKLEGASEQLTQFTQQVPDFGRGWFYLGMASQDWSLRKKYLLRAIQLSPGDPWIEYQTGKQFLRHQKLLTQNEKRFALDLVRQSIAAHRFEPDSIYLPKPSTFLTPALELLWKYDRDFKILQSVVPRDFPSYLVFSNFLREKKRWDDYTAVFPEFWKLQRDYYDQQCVLGEKFLAEGNDSRALVEFRKAFWSRSWDYQRAKAGVLASLAWLNQIPNRNLDLFQEDYHLTLKKILEENDEDFSRVLPYLKQIVKKAQDPSLNEQYNLRMSKSELPKTDTASSSAEGWWGAAVEAGHLLRKPGRASMAVNLKSGNSIFHLHLRSHGKKAYIAVYLNGKSIGKIFRITQKGPPAIFSVQTRGGKHWLQLELLNVGEKNKGPILELGSLEITH